MSLNRLSNLTIVVVEDNDDVRRYLGNFLAHSGANVLVAGNAFEGLEAVRNYRPHLVVSDISMPGRDGLAVLAGYHQILIPTQLVGPASAECRIRTCLVRVFKIAPQ